MCVFAVRMLVSSGGFHFMVPFSVEAFAWILHLSFSLIQYAFECETQALKLKNTAPAKCSRNARLFRFFFVRSMPTFVCFLSLCVFCFAVSFFFFHFSAKIRTVQCTLLYIHCFSSVMYIICLKVTVCSKCSHFQLCYIQCDNKSSNNNKNKRKKKLYYNGCYDNELPRASYSTFDFHTFPFTIFVYLLISDWNIHNECSVADLWI